MKNFYFLLVISLLLFSCKKETAKKNPINTPSSNPSSTKEMKVPAGFNYESYRTVSFEINVKNNQDLPFYNYVVDFYTALPEAGGALVFKGHSNKQGIVLCKLQLPYALKEVICNVHVLGIPENIVISVGDGLHKLELGGSNPKLIRTLELNQAMASPTLFKNVNKFSYRYLPAGWNSNGVPNNLINPRDVISNQLLADIWSALPSMQPVPVFHPSWLDDNLCKRTLLITQTSDVWVTFITEGAGFRNSLFYYKYAKNNPPTTASQIDSLYMVFPNASLNNSSGGLVSGDKVFIGRIGPDTVITYGIAPNGYNITNGTIGLGFGLLYANKDFNPEVNPALRQHMVMLRDPATGRNIMGFEDVTRNSAGCDHDFNDVLFYTTSNPVNAISVDSIAPLPPSSDGDGDGVNDVDDEYPQDPARAFNNYYPAKNVFGTVAFEDLWPYYGDYDLNDVVVDFNYKVITNAANEVKELNGTYVLKASGGQIENAFAVEFPTNLSNVANVTGSSLEVGQPKAVGIIYPNIRTVQNRWNTLPSEPYSDSVLARINFTLTNPIPLSTFGLNEYNPFIWGTTIGKNRGMEIHLPGKTPTALANNSLLGTGDDRTSITDGKYYLSETNLPWAIHIPVVFDYPTEKSDIVTAYLKFGAWAQSGGTVFGNWYTKEPGNRVPAKIYLKP
jgi:LruC domain-containing protein